MQRKDYTLETKVINADEGVYEAMISTEAVDREDDVLLAAGADLTNYMKNPVVLFGHNYWEPKAVVGKALEVEIIPGQGLRATWQFAGLDVSPDADLVRRLWEGGFLNATSVGFNPRKWEKRTSEDGEELMWGRKYTEWELLEFSIVPVPANQDALRLAMKSLLKEETTEEGNPAADEAALTESEPEVTDEPDTNDPPHDASEPLTEEVQAALREALNQLGEIYNG